MMRDESIEVGEIPTELTSQQCQTAPTDDLTGSSVETPELSGHVPFLQVRDALAQVESMTLAVFGAAPYEILEREDLEAGDPLYFTLRVAFLGEATDMLKRYDEWHDRLSAVSSSLRGMFRLSLDCRK